MSPYFTSLVALKVERGLFWAIVGVHSYKSIMVQSNKVTRPIFHLHLPLLPKKRHHDGYFEKTLVNFMRGEEVQALDFAIFSEGFSTGNKLLRIRDDLNDCIDKVMHELTPLYSH